MIFLDGGVAYKITEECSYTRVELTVPHAHSGTLQGVVYGHRESPVWGLWVPVLCGQSLKCYLTVRQYETFTTFLTTADIRVPAHQQVPENALICGQGIL